MTPFKKHMILVSARQITTSTVSKQMLMSAVSLTLPLMWLTQPLLTLQRQQTMLHVKDNLSWTGFWTKKTAKNMDHSLKHF